MSNGNGSAPAGWYPDPSGGPGQRYWDGTSWTTHLAPLVTAWPAIDDPSRDLADLRAGARRAKVAVLVAVPVYAISPAAQGVQIRASRKAFAELREQVTTLEASPPGTSTTTVRPFAPSPTSSLTSVLGLPPLIIGVLFVIWFHRAVTVAARLRRPARRTTGWAVGGWLIPIGSFFIPYQSARDIFRPDEVAQRRLVKRWWAAYLTASLVSLPLGVAVGFTEEVAAAVAAGALALVVWLFAALNASMLIDEANRSLELEAAAR